MESIEAFGKRFWLVPGTSPQVGRGRVFRYVVLIERGLYTHYGVSSRYIARFIDKTLADPRGWTRGGKVGFERVASPADADTSVYMASPDTVDKLCVPLRTLGEVSCCVEDRVVLNVVRWKEAVPHWDKGLRAYRTMVVNHEMGHRTGQGHRHCPGPGQRAPVMQQQTYGLQGCAANEWPLESEL